MVRGIVNVSGVSCHTSCVLQLLSHTIELWNEALQLGSVKSSSPFVRHLASVVAEILRDDESTPVNPTALYQWLRKNSKLNPYDVGDVSMVMHQFLQLLLSSDTAWEQVLPTWIHGQSCSVITGLCPTPKNPLLECIQRIKRGKSKRMACPYPLRGEFDSLESGLSHSISSPLVGYQWDRVAIDSYEEQLISTPTDMLDSDTSTEIWKTFKGNYLESIPPVWFLSLERFSYQDGELVLRNPKVSLPQHLDLSTLNPPESLPQDVRVLDGSMDLVGGILHIQEEEGAEGHVATIFRDRSSSSNQWVLVNDEVCSQLDEAEAIRLLEGGTNEEGHYCCATIVAYVQHERLLATRDDVLLTMYPPSTVANNPETPPPDGDQLVGRRLRVKWAKGKWYAGTVQSYNPNTQKHAILYDDGDLREYTLSKKTIEWL